MKETENRERNGERIDLIGLYLDVIEFCVSYRLKKEESTVSVFIVPECDSSESSPTGLWLNRQL